MAETKTLIDGTEVPFETRTRNTNKGYILLTPEEIAEEDARTAQAELEAPAIQAKLEEEEAIQKIMRMDAKDKYDKMTKAEKDALKEI